MQRHIQKIHHIAKRTLRIIHDAFLVSLTIKAINGVVETLGGLAVLLIGHQRVLNVVQSIAHRELVEDPDDHLATSMIQWATHFSSGAQEAVAAYLLAHGILKLFVVYNVMRGRRWAYPTAVTVFSGFAIYQAVLWIEHPGWTLAALTVFDVLIVVLTLLEWRVVHSPVEKTQAA